MSIFLHHSLWHFTHKLDGVTEQLTEAAKKAAKKAKKKAAAAAAKVTGADAKPGQQQSSNEDKGLEPPAGKDEDPEGLKMLAGEGTPVLEQAWKFLQPLLGLKEESLGGNVAVWVVVYDVAVRRGKYLQAVGALEKAKKAGGEDHPEVHVRVVDLKQRGMIKVPRQTVQQTLSHYPATILLDLNEPVKSVFEEAVKKLYAADLSVETFNSHYLQKHSQDPKAVIAAARALRLLKAPVDEVDNAIFSLLGGDAKLGVKVRIYSPLC